ncbi:MAG: Lrp/AsnC family transcriptional regulator [Thaumarchaeota archaeon]|nr:Lrp/AsnC family transcriptional regulator [Nitrososphaerota archaeon]
MKIISALYRDASVSIPKLSKDLNLNLSVTYSRIKRLMRRGVIEQFTLMVNEGKLGFPASAIVGVNLDPKLRELAMEEIAKLEAVREMKEVTGRFDVFVTLRAKTIEEIHKLVAEVVGKIQGVNQAEMFVEVATRRPAIGFKIAG